MPSKPLILTDLDGVLVPTPQTILDMVRAVYPGFEWTRYDPREIPGVDPAAAQLALGLLDREDVLCAISPRPEVSDFFGHLRARYDILIVTARPPRLAHRTSRDCLQWFGSVPIFEWDRRGLCEMLRPEVYVDDRGEAAVECAQVVPRTHLIRAPWNRHVEDPHVRRISSFAEIGKEDAP